MNSAVAPRVHLLGISNSVVHKSILLALFTRVGHGRGVYGCCFLLAFPVELCLRVNFIKDWFIKAVAAIFF